MGIFLGDRPVSVYFNGASASLPVQGVFLGGIQVFPTGSAAATLYFDGAVDGAWATVGNWWLDDAHTEPAGRLPTSADSVVASANITASGQTVADFTFKGEFSALLGTLAVTGNATFNDITLNLGVLTVSGVATFNDSSSNGETGGGTLNGNAVFNGNSLNAGTINGNAVFNDGSYNSDEGGTVNGNATFNDSSENDGTVTGTITDNR